MVELVVDDLMAKVVNNRAYVLVLREKDGLRRIVIALGMLEAQSIAFVLRKVDAGRPVTHDLFLPIAKAFGIQLENVLIDRVVNGTFYSVLHYVKDSEEAYIDSRTSDAIAIALRERAPIYIHEDLLNRMCIRDEKNGAISLPITAADEETLRAAMDNAVKEENYELAMKLKEEIDSRHHKGSDDLENTKEQ